MNNIISNLKPFHELGSLSNEFIAEVIKIDSSELEQLITNNQKDFSKFGFLSNFPQDEKIEYFLNEKQIYLLLNYLENTQEVQAFKKEILSIFHKRQKQALKNKKFIEPKELKSLFKIARVIITDKNIHRIYDESL